MTTRAISHFIRSCRKIVGVAKNFRIDGAHPSTYPTDPIIFLKAPTSMIEEGIPIKIPEGYGAINYEVELGAIIGVGGSNIPEENALDHIAGYCLALDMTAMNKIKENMSNGHPWVLGKSWDTFTPVSDFIEKKLIPNPNNIDLWLTLDGETKQSGNTKDLIFDIGKTISYTSKIMKLEKGDLFLPGTVSGVGPCTTGQVIECGIKNIDKEMKFIVV